MTFVNCVQMIHHITLNIIIYDKLNLHMSRSQILNIVTVNVEDTIDVNDYVRLIQHKTKQLYKRSGI